MSDELKERLTLAFYSELLTSFGNDRDFDDMLADELAGIAIKELQEREAKLVEALRFYARQDNFLKVEDPVSVFAEDEEKGTAMISVHYWWIYGDSDPTNEARATLLELGLSQPDKEV